MKQVFSQFDGRQPKVDGRILPATAADQAWNCDLSSGTLAGLRAPELVTDLSAVVGDVRRAYRIPATVVGDPDAWLALPSEFSSVCRSPLANDTSHRVYWTNPGEGAFWSTYARVLASTAPYNLGYTAPDQAQVPTLSASGGTTDGSIALVERTYVYTFIDEYGFESNPSAPTAVVAGASDGSWTVGNLPTSPPSAPVGKVYPTVASMRLYRVLVGDTSGAQYFMVDDLSFGSATYVDTIPDTTVVNNLTLESADYEVPLDTLDGLVAMPGGMLAGFTENTVHFCEVNRPHAWPSGYDLSLQYKVVGLAVWQQSLVALTEGFPSNGTGTSPAAFVFTTIQVPEPCIARGSIVTDISGVYYSSSNGMILLNYYGMQNATDKFISRKQWLTDFDAANIVAARHRSQYLAINGSGEGFILDAAEARQGAVNLNTFNGAVCVWNDAITASTYIMADKKVYLWDSPTADPLTFRWRSKPFYLAKPVNLGAVLVSSSDEILTDPGAPAEPLLHTDVGDLDLDDGVNTVFRLMASTDSGSNMLQTEKELTEVTQVFRGRSGIKAHVWQFEVVSRVPVRQVVIAEVMKELRD